MANIKEAFGTSNQTITITLNALASSATVGRASTVVDNTTNLYIDALVQVIINMPAAGSPANDKAVYVFAYATANGGTNYTDSITGTDAGFTRTDPPNLRLIGTINCPASNKSYTSSPMSVAAAFGGVLPDHWGIAVFNFTGLTLNAASNSAFYQGVYATSV
jgi:hypothetical protein